MNNSNTVSSTSKQAPRDVFLYLLTVITLAMTSVNLGSLLFQVINIYLPDVVSDRYAFQGYHDSIRWGVAILVIVFPVFVWAMRFLKRDIATNFEKRELKIRRWLLYLTLFVAALVIIGDLVALVYNFLQGELTVRIFMKILVIFGIAGAIFYYYLNDLQDKNAGKMKMLAWTVVAVVVASVVGGMVMAGLPQSQRLKRLDDQRVQDLQLLQSQVIIYWQGKNKLPATLDDLRNGVGGFIPPPDSQTGLAYEYQVSGPLKFVLCATFQSSNLNDAVPVPYKTSPTPAGSQDLNGNWLHDAARTCFDRTIDPELDRPFGKMPPAMVPVQ